MSVTNRYFLAANGFSGFRCHFPRLLNSPDIKKLYIIKGGSGVGKSTLMRRVSSHFSDIGFSVEEILCSSDPNSLDGVVIRSETGAVVLIDGTAPHEYDMKYPGIRDITLDLSRHLDERAIEKEREKIVTLIIEKKKCYESAYKLLHLAGNSYAILRDTAIKHLKNDKIKSLAKSLFSDKVECAKVESNLYSAFCKSGVVSLDTNDKNYKNAYYFEAGYKSELLLSRLFEEAKRHYTKISVLKSPFSDDIIEGFSADQELILKTSDATPNYKSDSFFEDFGGLDLEIAAECEKVYTIAIESARRALCQASEFHAELEKIFGTHMDFEKNTALLSDLTMKIESEI